MQTLPTPASVRPFGETLPELSHQIETARTLPRELVDQLIDLGVFRMWVPESLGGAQLSLAQGLEVIEELSYWDSAAGWCAMIGATTAIQSAYLPEPHATTIYREDPRIVTGGVAEPRGRAQPTAEGLIVNGRWAWGSGCGHCQWIGGGCLVADDQGKLSPRPLFVFFERNQVEFHDTWHTGGLRGTGSGDFEVQDAFVPDGRWVELGTSNPEAEGTLYRYTTFGPLAMGVAFVGMGLARRALAELTEIASVKRYVGSRRSLATRPGVQSQVAESEARLLAARALLDLSVADSWKAAERNELEVEHRRRLRLAATHAMQTAVSVVDSMYELAGGSAVFASCPLERLLRDVHAAATHGIVAKRTFELSGRLALGVETNVHQL